MKKIISLVIAATMVISSMAFFAPAQYVQAVEKSSVKDPALKGKSTLEYKEGEAIVVLKRTKATSRDKAKKLVSGGSGLTVEKMWSFSEGEGNIPEESGLDLPKKGPAGDLSRVNILLVTSKNKSTKTLLKELSGNSNVLCAEPNYKIELSGVSTDAYSQHQWGLEDIKVKNVWDGGNAGADLTDPDAPVVAIVDSGVDYRHEDLKDSMWTNEYQPALKGDYGFDIVNGDDDPMDDNGHGSHCAGIIGAEGNNSLGISGVNQKVRIMALKTFDEYGVSYASEEIGAYHYINRAMDLGVNVRAINNSWGGGEISEVFELLIELTGSKGAVTVCAAGNEENNNDQEKVYPASISSPYLISVAALATEEKLASFSNYGKNSVDIAAPGTNILSTVCYDCYNPGIYTQEKQSSVSQAFSDYNDGDEGDFSEIIKVDEDGFQPTESGITEEEHFGRDGGCLRFNFENMSSNDTALIRIPWELTSKLDFDEAPDFSAMIKATTTVPKDPEDYAGVGYVACVDGDMSYDKIVDIAEEESVIEFPADEGRNYWSKCYISMSNQLSGSSKKREIVIVFTPRATGDFTLYLDDVGISKEGSSIKDKYGKYDFYSGTSMAAPHVTGAVALLASDEAYKYSDADDLAVDVLSKGRKCEDLKGKVKDGTTLDFTGNVKLRPRVTSTSVDFSGGRIYLEGNFLDQVREVTIKGKNAEILDKNPKCIELKARSGWIGSIVNIEIKGDGFDDFTKENVYLVNGKKSYSSIDTADYDLGEVIATTDGSKVYAADNENDRILVAGKNMAFDELSSMEKPEEFFDTSDVDDLERKEFSYGDQLAYMDGYIYCIGEYSSVVEVSEHDFDWFFSKDKSDYFMETTEEESSGVKTEAYSTQYSILSIGRSSGKVKKIKMPSDNRIKSMDGWTLGAYNGKLYLIGGYDYKAKAPSKTVWVYDTSKKTWKKSYSLPEGRAEGYAIQSGNKLIYTLGYGEAQKGQELGKQECPVNLIFDGKKWVKSSKKIYPYNFQKVLTRSKEEYGKYGGSIGICKSGIVYIGFPATGLGDTFYYDVANDKFIQMKYNLRESAYNTSMLGFTYGSSIVGLDDYNFLSKAAISTGLVKMSCQKNSGGTVTGVDKYVTPGSKITIKVTPKKKYKISKFTVNGKKVKGSKTTVRITSNGKVVVKFKRK